MVQTRRRPAQDLGSCSGIGKRIFDDLSKVAKNSAREAVVATKDRNQQRLTGHRVSVRCIVADDACTALQFSSLPSSRKNDFARLGNRSRGSRPKRSAPGQDDSIAVQKTLSMQRLG